MATVQKWFSKTRWSQKRSNIIYYLIVTVAWTRHPLKSTRHIVSSRKFHDTSRSMNDGSMIGNVWQFEKLELITGLHSESFICSFDSSSWECVSTDGWLLSGISINRLVTSFNLGMIYSMQMLGNGLACNRWCHCHRVLLSCSWSWNLKNR